MKSDVCRGALKWDLAQKANRILKDTNEAEPSECETLPLSDGSAAESRLDLHRRPAKHSNSQFVDALSTCPQEPAVVLLRNQQQFI